MMKILSPSSWTVFLDCTCSVKSCGLLPILHYGRDSSRIYSRVHYHQMDTKLQAYDIFEIPILNLRFDLINPRINSSFSIMMVSWRNIWELTQSYSSRHARYRLNSLKTNLPITPWISPWSSHSLLHYLLLTTLNPTYGSIIVYGQVLQTSLNATISPKGLSLITKTTHGAPYVLSGMSTYGRDALAIIESLKRWKHYFARATLIIRTDQQSLKYIQEQKLT
jgi:hypothetical protein